MKAADLVHPGSPAIKIICVVSHEGGSRLRRLIFELGIEDMTTQHARQTLLRERRVKIRESVALSEKLVEVVKFHVDEASEERVIMALADGYGFGKPGFGSIVSQKVNLVGIAPPSSNLGPPAPPDRNVLLRRELAGLSCIVPRGTGTAIARVMLSAGLGVPVVTYAEGVASRGRLGLIRVTIPAEKEIVTVFVGRRDIGEAFRMVNEMLHTNRPGVGFSYWYPLSLGLLDTRIWMGGQPHVASMEQIIAALDMITGDTAWRSKLDRGSGHAPVSRGRLTSYAIHGPEIETEPVVNSALAAGATGATLTRVHREMLRAADDAPSAYESSELIIPSDRLPRIHETVSATHLIEQAGFIEIAEVGEASGYRLPAPTPDAEEATSGLQ